MSTWKGNTGGPGAGFSTSLSKGLLGTEHFDCYITGNRKRQMVIQDNLTHVFIPLTPAEIEATESECLINPAWHIVVPNG